MSISELRNILSSQEAELKKLQKRRAGLQGEIDAVDARLAQLGGGSGRGTGAVRGRPKGSGGRRRARNEQSLVVTLESVLTGKTKPMDISEIVAAVQAAGYRSSSPNFRSIVNQTLIKEKKRFGSAGRGLYQMKK